MLFLFAKMTCESIEVYPFNLKLPLLLSYYIVSVIRWMIFPFQDNLKDVDPSYKMDLDLGDCFGKEKPHFIAELHKPDLHICSKLHLITKETYRGFLLFLGEYQIYFIKCVENISYFLSA